MLKLDKEQYGRGLSGIWWWAFYCRDYTSKKLDDDGSMITVSCVPFLVAVTDKQYKQWSKMTIVRKHRLLLFVSEVAKQARRLLCKSLLLMSELCYRAGQ